MQSVRPDELDDQVMARKSDEAAGGKSKEAAACLGHDFKVQELPKNRLEPAGKYCIHTHTRTHTHVHKLQSPKTDTRMHSYAAEKDLLSTKSFVH